MPIPLIRYVYLLLLLASACGCHQPSYQQPDAVRDLLIDRIVWRPRVMPNRPDGRIDEHQFSLTNTSDTHGYRQIQLRFDYYDERYRRVATKRYQLPTPIGAGTAAAIAPIQLGPTNPLAKSAEIHVETAQAD